GWPWSAAGSRAVSVAQLGRALDCGSSGRGFESLHSPHPKPPASAGLQNLRRASLRPQHDCRRGAHDRSQLSERRGAPPEPLARANRHARTLSSARPCISCHDGISLQGPSVRIPPLTPARAEDCAARCRIVQRARQNGRRKVPEPCATSARGVQAVLRDADMASLESSRAFWDEKARENPYWYVSSFVDYADADVESFWASGASIWAEVKAQTGYVPRRSDIAVEIGCGVGRITRAMARELGAVHAFDISRAMIERAARNAPENAHFHWSDGATLRPIDSGSADLVLAYLVFQHLPDQAVYARYLNEMVRVAKPGGMIAFTTSPRNWKALLLPLLRARAYLAQRRDATGPRGLHRSEW